MIRYDKITPPSTRDLLFDECEGLRAIQNRLCALYAGRGFREVMTPSLEFLDVFENSHGTIAPQQMVKLTDSQNRLLCMRPDCTVPIARMVCTKLGALEGPLRLYYNTQVYSTPREHAGKAAEFSQVGVELIGENSAGSDVEILSLAAESLAALGAGGRLEICHIGIFQALIAALGVAPEAQGQVRALIEQKSFAALGGLLEPLAARRDARGAAARALAALPRLFGGREVLSRAGELLEGGPARGALDELEHLYGRLVQAGLEERVMVDLGLINQPDYYTGVIFCGYIEGAGEPVLSGGRYDDLLARFGRDLPATGFGVNASLAAQCGQQRRQAGQGAGEPATTKPTITLALTKGRLEKRTVQMLEDLGYDCACVREKGRRLILPLGDSGIRVILAKAADVVTYVESGVADVGVVGKDTIMESDGGFYEVLDLKYGRCRFAVACPKGSSLYAGYRAKVIASKYPRVALTYFQGKGMDVDVVKIEGSVELAPLVGLADAIVDIVETGSTLRENGLEVVEEIAPVSARLVVNTAAMKLKKEPIGTLIEKIEGYVSRLE